MATLSAGADLDRHRKAARAPAEKPFPIRMIEEEEWYHRRCVHAILVRLAGVREKQLAAIGLTVVAPRRNVAQLGGVISPAERRVAEATRPAEWGKWIN